MGELFEVKPVDRAFYAERIKDFLPDRLIDVHCHVWTNPGGGQGGEQRGGRGCRRARELSGGPGGHHSAGPAREQGSGPGKGQMEKPTPGPYDRVQSWPQRVASQNPIEDLIETYRLMFPDKQVTALIFGTAANAADLDADNAYVQQSARKAGFPALMVTPPSMDAETFEERVAAGGFLGAKVYLTLAPEHLKPDEICIFDFLPHHLLEVVDRRGWVVMLHIPRSGRLRDPVNLEQMLEIERRYPNARVIIAHVGRAYCIEDVGNAFGVLSGTEKLVFDISANSNQRVFERLIETVGPKRILFGSDLPILRMRARRICECGRYVNLVPRGLYGDVSADPHVRELDGEEAEALTFFLYEEIDAFRRAAANTGLLPADIEDVFYGNAARILGLAR